MVSDAVPVKAVDGIDPLDVMLQSMRECWERAYRLDAAGRAEKEAALRMPQGPERDAAYKAALDKLVLAGLETKNALAIAKDAAPYKHAKLSSTNMQLQGDVHIHRKTF